MWKINVRGTLQRRYEIFFLPTIKFNNWSSTRFRVTEEGTHKKVSDYTEYALSIAFLTAQGTLSLNKDVPVASE